MSSKQLKVFLCHASADKPRVRDIRSRLKADGIDAWLDSEDLLPGQEWTTTIPEVIRGSDAILICLSRYAIAKEGYVQREIAAALDVAQEKPEGTIFVIPARLERCEIPQRLSRFHCVDLFGDADVGFQKLEGSLRKRYEDLIAKGTQTPETAISRPALALDSYSSLNVSFPCTVTRATGWFSDGHAPYADTISIDRRALMLTVLQRIDWGRDRGGKYSVAKSPYGKREFVDTIMSLLKSVGKRGRPWRTELHFQIADAEAYLESLVSEGLVIAKAFVILTEEGKRRMAALENNHVRRVY